LAVSVLVRTQHLEFGGLSLCQNSTFGIICEKVTNPQYLPYSGFIGLDYTK